MADKCQFNICMIARTQNLCTNAALFLAMTVELDP